METNIKASICINLIFDLALYTYQNIFRQMRVSQLAKKQKRLCVYMYLKTSTLTSTSTLNPSSHCVGGRESARITNIIRLLQN